MIIFNIMSDETIVIIILIIFCVTYNYRLLDKLDGMNGGELDVILFLIFDLFFIC